MPYFKSFGGLDMKKGFLAGVATTLLVLCMVTTAGATNGKFQKEIEYRDIKVSLDGQILDLRDAKGNVVEPFMFGGTNYIPARALAEALGLEVAWDGANSTVVLTHPNAEEDNVDILLSSKDHIRFYYTGLVKRSDGGYDFKIRCENDSDYKITAYLRDFSVNGKVLRNMGNETSIKFDCTVEPGRILNTVVSIPQDKLDAQGITEVKRFKTGFAGYDTGKSGWNFETGGDTINIQ